MDFQQYDNDNPKIWGAFIFYTNQTIGKGFEHYGAKGIIELIRWHHPASGNDSFKINNNYAPEYARKFMNRFPQYEGFFRTRIKKN